MCLYQKLLLLFSLSDFFSNSKQGFCSNAVPKLELWNAVKFGASDSLGFFLVVPAFTVGFGGGYPPHYELLWKFLYVKLIQKCQLIKK